MIAMNINTNDNACSEVESLQSVVYLWSLSLAPRMEAIIHFTVPVCLFLSFDSSLTYWCVLKSAYCIDKTTW